jgi:3-hexulose-6-phosphate synthase
MKLQLALDTDKKKALQTCEKVKQQVDIIELGTPLIKSEGLGIIKQFKKFRKPILADMKTMDTGFYEAELAFKAGADIMTVCGVSDNETIKGAVRSARKRKKKVMVDLICVDEKKIVKRAKEVLRMGADYVSVHTGIDMQKKGGTPLSNLKKISKVVSKNKIAVAGGINISNIDEILKYKPAIVIVGGAITKAKKPKEIAIEMKKEPNLIKEIMKDGQRI